MNFKITRLTITAILLLVLSGCLAGNGAGLDEFGNVIKEITEDEEVKDNPKANDSQNENPQIADVSNKATLAWLQANIFDPICGQCHKGASAPLGMKLSPNAGLTLITNERQSEEAPELREIEPGDPENSYLIKKIKGARGIKGGRMPLGLTPLNEEQISAMETWVANGALLTENDPLSKPGFSDTIEPSFNGIHTLTNIEQGKILLEWDSAIDDITSTNAIRYHVFISNESGNYSKTPLAITNPGAQNHIISNVANEQQIYIKVLAEDIAGNLDSNNMEVPLWVTSM